MVVCSWFERPQPEEDPVKVQPPSLACPHKESRRAFRQIRSVDTPVHTVLGESQHTRQRPATKSLKRLAPVRCWDVSSPPNQLPEAIAETPSGLESPKDSPEFALQRALQGDKRNHELRTTQNDPSQGPDFGTPFFANGQKPRHEMNMKFGGISPRRPGPEEIPQNSHSLPTSRHQPLSWSLPPPGSR